ncbi:MAG: peptidoglycan-binding protein [Burkholderiales bacterium]|nr:peptidoglycan-binding protein [Burkholderiales bacterium]
MPRPTLRLFDGYDHTSPRLRRDVRDLQRRLRKLGLPVEADGYFGRETEVAVIRFQSEHGLDNDGIAGPRTWAVLLGQPLTESTSYFETTLTRDDAGMLPQLVEARRYQVEVSRTAAELDFPAALIAGIGSRESGWGLALKPKGPEGTGDFIKRSCPTALRRGPLPPDGGYGRGLMQVDFDAHEFARSGRWQDPEQNIRYGCKVLADNRAFFQRRTNLAGAALLRAMLSAYNCGPGNTLRALNSGLDVDYYTAHRDYSADTLNRAGFFRLHGWN